MSSERSPKSSPATSQFSSSDQNQRSLPAIRIVAAEIAITDQKGGAREALAARGVSRRIAER